MAVHIRLARYGSKKHPIYRIVVADHHRARDGRFIENIGTFDPANDGKLELDRSRFEHWQKCGAQASHTLTRIIKAHPAPADAPSA